MQHSPSTRRMPGLSAAASTMDSPSLDTTALRLAPPDLSASVIWNGSKPFVKGGLSGMGAWMFVQPCDIVKVRIQLGNESSPISVARQVYSEGGFLGFYRGLSAGLLRQATYTTARIGTFNSLSDQLKARQQESQSGKACLPLWQKAGVGLAAGAVGALVGSPADLALVRMQADQSLPLEQRRNYRGVRDAFLRIVREEGVLGLYRGVGPTICRAMALNMGMLASNDEAKEMLVKAGFQAGSKAVILGGATTAGFFAAACSLPFDFMKTRLQEMTRGANGEFPYKGLTDCALKTLRHEGVLKFYTGFPTYCARIAPSATLTLLFMAALPF